MSGKCGWKIDTYGNSLALGNGNIVYENCERMFGFRIKKLDGFFGPAKYETSTEDALFMSTVYDKKKKRTSF